MKVFEIVAVYDNLSETYLEPRFFGTLAEAQRVFEYQINTIDLWKANAGDFELWSLGKYDSETGVITSECHKYCNGRSLLRRETQDDLQPVKSTEA